jgi:hypothetical protein
MADWRRILKKIRTMDRDELIDRARQELAKRTDAALSLTKYDFARNAVQPGRTSSGKFFFGANQIESLLALLRQRLPQQVEKILSTADRICAHRFRLLGYEDLHFGTPINWHVDIIHAKQAPMKPFHQIQYLDFAEVGDSKIIWEINRHQHLVTLAKAYRLTRDERYSRELLAQWQDWQAANPYPRGVNWASTLEVGFRSLSWIWLYQLLEATPALGADFRGEYLRAQALNGRHLERYLSTYFSPNTHLLGEAVALFFLGTLCGELAGAERWKALGWKIIVQEAQLQVNPDGFHFEQSTYYHVYALDFFLHAALLASANGEGLPKELEEKLEKMSSALFSLGMAGPPPRFGDDDGGRLFDPARNGNEHLLDPLSTAAILFSRADFKVLAGSLREETIWLLGEAGVQEWDGLEKIPLSAQTTSLPSAGVYVLAANKSQLVIDGGAAVRQSSGHEHADALSVCLQSGGRQLLIDPGTFEYVGDGPERNQFRGTAMHNTLRVDNEDQAVPTTPFSWQQRFNATAERWIAGESFDYFAGSHDGYQRLHSPVTHRRWTVALHSGIFLVRDRAEGAGEHRIDISWHLAQDLQLHAEGLFRFKNAAPGLALFTVCDGWSEEVHKGAWSPVYGQQRTATVLNFGIDAALPVEFATVLVPLEEAYEIPGTFTRVEHTEQTSSLSIYRYLTATHEHHFYFASAGQPWSSQSVASDAEFVCVSRSQLNGDSDVVLCNGSYVELEGLRVLAAKSSVQRCELLSRDGRQVFCSEPDKLVTPLAEKSPPESPDIAVENQESSPDSLPAD